MKKITLFLIYGVLLVNSAYAETFYLQGVNYDGIKTTVNFDYDGINKAIITLNNTSNIDSILTAFAFNLPLNDGINTNYITGVTDFSFSGVQEDTWDYIFDPNKIDLPQPFGIYDVGAYTTPHFNSGNPNEGIFEGNSATFYFTFSGFGLDNLTTADFLSILSYEENQNDHGQYFIARYQGVGEDRDGSDVGVPVPEPSTFVLLGLGFIGVAYLNRRKRNV